MSAKKIILIKSIILSIFCISIYTATVDFSRLFGSYDLYAAYQGSFIKRINVILAALLVWLAGKDGMNKEDITSLKFVFFIICCAEVLFLMAKPALAIGTFSVCQCLLISRHCKGFKRKLKAATCVQKLNLSFLLLTLICILFWGVITLYPMADNNTPVFLGLLYGFLLSVSLWAGLSNFILNLTPSINSKMIAIGMLCFYLGDISVGLDGLLWPGTAWLLVTSLTWVFYTPAITLLALSCYKYAEVLSLTKRRNKSL